MSCAPERLNPLMPPSTLRMSPALVRSNIHKNDCNMQAYFFWKRRFLSSPVEEVKEKALQRYNKVRVSISHSEEPESSSHIVPTFRLGSFRVPIQSAWFPARTTSPCSCGILRRIKSLWPGWPGTAPWSTRCSSPPTPGSSLPPRSISPLKSGTDGRESEQTYK